MLDEINRKLIIALSKDGRYSYAKLARELGIKPATVAKRVDSMLKDDIFTINAIPNPAKMGYKVMAVINLDVELTHVDNVCDKLAENPNISYISTTFGRFDILLMVEYRDLESLYKLVREEIPNMEGVKSVETFIISEMRKRYQAPTISNSKSPKPVSISEIDDELIKELRKDGRATFTSLAKKYGVSPAMVSRRVTSLVKRNVIQITIAPNPTKLGRPIVAYVGMKVQSNKLDKVASQLSAYSQVPQVMTLISGYDILAVVAFSNLEELSKFIMKEIASIEGVINVETLVRAEFRKRTYLGFDFEKALQQLA
jgi:Lrp/AsnC family transcriptional regulator, regulator for asnA, asnC and gidA